MEYTTTDAGVNTALFQMEMWEELKKLTKYIMLTVPPEGGGETINAFTIIRLVVLDGCHVL